MEPLILFIQQEIFELAIMVHMLQLMMELVIFDPCQIPLSPTDRYSLVEATIPYLKASQLMQTNLVVLIWFLPPTAGKMQAQQETIFFQS